MNGHWCENPRDTYLGIVYTCCWCHWRLSECKCPPDPPGWEVNRYPVGIDAGLYNIGPILAQPSSFVRMADTLADTRPPTG